VTKIREEVTIEAPAAHVWTIVHEDLKNARKWTANLKKASVVEEDEEIRIVRYDLELPAWSGSIEVAEDVWEPPRECAGRFVKGPLKGTWSYTYRERAGTTKLIYAMDYELAGVLRLLGGMLAGQYAAGIRDTMASLKKYVESGKGPRA
jgi:carbon monoxide dehydrogenase subunit G